MAFTEKGENDFLMLFDAVKGEIAAFEGCRHVELLKEDNQKGLYFTYSLWDSEKALNKYRNSDLFKETWAKTRLLFATKPEAWSLSSIN